MKKILPILVLLLVFLAGCEKKVLDPKLPDLTNKTTEEVSSILTEAKIAYELIEESDFDKPNNVFIKYDTHSVGDEIKKDVIVKVHVNSHVLPDLTGKTESEIISLFEKVGKDVVVVFDDPNNDFADMTWAGYDGANVGDKLSAITADEIKVKIAINSFVILPDLVGLNKYQIGQALNDALIQFNYVYIEDDTKEADTFHSFEGYEAGEKIEPTQMVTVNLYSNSFLNANESLFISKFYDNGDFNKAVELYNPTNAAINLADYSIAVLQNGSVVPTYTIPLDGQLDSHSTFIIAHPGGNRDVSKKANLSTTSLVFDGNDVIQLRYKNGSYVDIVNVMGTRLVTLTNEVYVRQEDIKAGTRTFDFNAWDEYIGTYVEPFGTHPFSAPESFEIDMSFAARSFGDPLGGFANVTLVTTTDGDTAEFTPGFLSNARIRFLGVDTPETHPVVQPVGLEAKAFTRSLLESATQIYLQNDPGNAYKETYGRHIGLIWADGQLVNYLIVKNGFSNNFLTAETKLVYNNRYLYRWFQDAEQYAKDNNLGVHAQ